MIKCKKIKKILIANRGEIAIRIMKTCKEMGINTVAIFSDVDRSSPHVLYASEAYNIEESQTTKSYLCIDKIIEITKKSGATAIHPGYGFLSENKDFAKEVENADITLIGPSYQSMKLMSSKVLARKIVNKNRIPIVPGVMENINNYENAIKKAKEVGFPIMLKPTAGGGGKGMRKIENLNNFKQLFISAKSEAKSSFGDDSVYIEKCLTNPRHIEIQIFSDLYGNTIYFPERECSIQRRHQKLIEESPSVFINSNTRQNMGNIACKIAKLINYIGAGTVEFLVDKHQKFFFMEMNTRLQVEHAISEMITGIDLVYWQIKIAQKEKLKLKQKDIKINGWSIEARICAEDSSKNFLPMSGLVKYFEQPNGPFTRIDTNINTGSLIPIEYDSMIAKIIVWGNKRIIAIQRLKRALDDTKIIGCIHNIQFLLKLLNFKPFKTGIYDTNIISNFMSNFIKHKHNKYDKIALIASALIKFQQNRQIHNQKETKDTQISAWRTNSGIKRQL